MQIEWLTAGHCVAGMHEVVVTNRTLDAIKLAKEQNRSLWRVSSTVSEDRQMIIITCINKEELNDIDFPLGYINL